MFVMGKTATEVRSGVQCVCPVCLGDLQHIFLILVRKVGTIPIVEGIGLQRCRKQPLLDLATFGSRDSWLPKISLAKASTVC